MDNLFNDVFTQKANEYVGLFVDFAPKAIVGGLVFIFGLRIINKMNDLIKLAIDKAKLNKELAPFVSSVANIALKMVLFFIVAGIVGVETTKFMAVLGAAVFAIGMGLQGSLGHFAAGILILVFRPYKVGDVVEVQGQFGIVRGIQMINTHIELFDKKMAIIPNGTAISDIVRNHSFEGIVRVDTEISMPYNEEFDRVEDIIKSAVMKTPKVLSEPKPFVGIKEFESHSIRLVVWPFAKVEDYWDVLFMVNKNIKKALGENSVKVAYSEGVELGEIGK